MMRLFDLMMGQPGMVDRPHSMQRQRFVGTGGPGQAMPMYPQTGGNLPPQSGGYDSSGINPHGMYTGGFQHPRQMPQPTMQPQMPPRQFPQNPGGFQPMSLASLFRR